MWVQEFETLKDQVEARASQAEAQLSRHRTAANGDGPMRIAHFEEKAQIDSSEKEVLRLHCTFANPRTAAQASSEMIESF